MDVVNTGGVLAALRQESISAFATRGGLDVAPFAGRNEYSALPFTTSAPPAAAQASDYDPILPPAIAPSRSDPAG